MISADRRYCDTCDIPILEREAYFVAILPTEEIERMLDRPETAPTYTPLSDGNRLEVCHHCVARRPKLKDLMALVDPARCS